MVGLQGLLFLLLAGLLWRWFVWNRRFAALKDSLADLGKVTAELVKRLERTEKRIDRLGLPGPLPHVGIEEQPVARAAIGTETTQLISEATSEPAVAAASEAEEAALGPEVIAPEPESVRSVPPWPQEQAPEKHEVPSVTWTPAPQTYRRQPWRVLPLKIPELIGTSSGKAVDWETLIGGHWLNVIGIIVFVVGMALFAQYSLRQFGPTGKIVTGFVTSGILLAAGILLEKVERYRLLARSLAGGGWALLYFTAYAAHNIEASRVITNPAIGLLLMGGVAAGIIAHSISYRSELLTGLAYGVGFFAIAITPLNSYTLIATALLALSQIAVLRFLPWHYLVLVAVAGTYLNHGRWLGETIEQRPEFWLSQSVLCLYWLLFVTMLLVRDPKSRQESLLHLTVNVANTVGMLGLSAWQIWVLHGEHLHYLTAPALVAYAGVATIARFSDRKDLFQFNSFVAVALFTVTLPLALSSLNISKDWLAIYWTAGAIVVTGIGYRLRDLALRLEGHALCGAAFVAVFAFNLQSALSLADWQNVLWWVAPLMIITFLGFSESLERIAGGQGIHRAAGQLGQLYAYAATAIVVSFLWKVSDPCLVGLCWLAAGLVFFEVGTWRGRSVLRNQGLILFTLSFAALIAINLSELYPTYSSLMGAPALARWSIVGTAAATYYYLFWQLRREQAGDRSEGFDYAGLSSFAAAEFGDLSSFAATTLVTVLIWKELDPALVALAWIGLGLILFEVGARSSPVLRSQGYVLFGLAFITLLSINLYEIYPTSSNLSATGLLPRWTIVTISATAYYYLFWRLHYGARFALTAIEIALSDPLAIAGTALVTMLAWKELDPVSVAVAWAFLALVLFELGNGMGLARITQQGHVLALLSFGRLFMANFIALGEVIGISHRVLTVVPVTALYYYLYTQTKGTPAYNAFGKQLQMSQLYSWGAAITLAALSRFEFGRAYAVLGMAPLFVAFLILGRYLSASDFRIQSYLLAGLTFARCWSTNAYLIGTVFGVPERVVTMLPVVGAFACATALCMRRMPTSEQKKSSNLFLKALQLIDTYPQRYFALLAAASTAVLFYYELPIGWVTTAFAIEGLILVLTGIASEERTFRIYGLVLLLISLLKLVTVDVSGVEPIYRILSYIVVGLMLLTASLIYTRYRSVVEKYI